MMSASGGGAESAAATASRLVRSASRVAGAPRPRRTASGAVPAAKASLPTAPIPAERRRSMKALRVQGGSRGSQA